MLPPGVVSWDRAVPIVLSDTNGTNKFRGVLCITAGNLVFNCVDELGNFTANITLAMTANTILPIGISTALATGTTGTYAGLVI